MAANPLSDLDVLVLGLGDSGLAMARWCSAHGARVTVWDSRDAPPQAAALGTAGRLVGGTLDPSRAAEAALVLKSPGLAPDDARIAPLLAVASARGTAVLGELDLFVRALADLRESAAYAPDLLAVTGTNGKTTTVAMTALLVQRAGRSVVLAGNVGPTLLDTLTAVQARAREDWPAVWVLELSSFQLEGGGDGVRDFEPTAAAVLNLSQDHLDWHGTMTAYGAAKARIFGRHAAAVVNRDDPAVMALLPAAPQVPNVPNVSKGTKGRKAVIAPARAVIRFGLDAPTAPGDYGLLAEQGIAWLVRALPAADGGRPRKGAPVVEIHLQRLMPADALRVRGRHNAANALAA
ncbi:MAG: Mur ligase family protein, partial [Rubrivivax sp.]